MEVAAPPPAGAGRTGWAAGAVTAAGFLAVSWALGVTPGRPIADRTDVFFQSDAGGLIRDAATGADQRGRGVHPLVYPLWTWPLHRLARVLEPRVPAGTTASVGSRLLVALAAGAGVGVLAAGLVRRGVSPRVLAAVAPVYILGSGQTLAAVPDHFGISQGVLAAALGVFAVPGAFRWRAAALAGLTLLAFGVTVTNAVFPAGLLTLLAARRYTDRLTWRVCAAAAAVGLLGAGVGTGVLLGSKDWGERFRLRVRLYMTWRLTDDPAGAAKRAARGAIDSAVAPAPAVDTNNHAGLPMLTYEPRGAVYPVWPYDAARSIGAAAWLALLGTATVRACRDREDRWAALAVWGWFGWNAVFHNLWGDEYFLYTPHYSWPLAALATLGLRGAPAVWVLLPALAVAAAATYTLSQYRAALDTVPV